jgi:hypothetical protein
MKRTIEFKGLVAAVKDGIVGALAFSGFCLVLIIVANVFRHTLPVVACFLNYLARECTLAELLTTAGCVGFVFCVLVRRRLRSIQSGMLPLAVAAIPLIIGAWLLDDFAGRVSIAQNAKLTDFTNNPVNIEFQTPRGHGFVLTLEVPDIKMDGGSGVSRSAYVFSGRVRVVSKENTIADFPVSSQQATLTSRGFILTGVSGWNTNAPDLTKLIKSHSAYQLEVFLNPAPPQSSALWLSWRQAARDKP